MTSYTVKLYTFDGRSSSLQLSADDVLLAAKSAVPYFDKLGEHVDGAAAIIVERENSAFTVFRPSDVLISMRAAHGDELERSASDHPSAQPTESGASH